MDNPFALAPFMLLLLGFVAYCLFDLWRHEPRLLPRWVWVIICLASIPIGGIVYLLAGRGTEPAVDDATRVDRASAPDSAASPSTRHGLHTASADARPSTGAVAVVSTTALRKVYGDHAALDGVDLHVPTGSVFGLVGPNGAGKTTLLAILAGLRRASAGTVALGVPPSKVALLPDTPQFDPWLTATEVVELSRGLVAPHLDPQRSRDALFVAGLADVADRRTGGFSRGMLQRLGVAATIVGEPELLLLDEPCSALDPLGRRDMLDLIGRLGGDHTVLFCSHILDDVQEVCDTVGILRDGRLLFQGRLADLLVDEAAPTLTVRLRAPLTPSIEALTNERWVSNVEQIGAEELRITASTLDDAEAHLARALADAGARVVSVAPSGTDLESVFLRLTSEPADGSVQASAVGL